MPGPACEPFEPQGAASVLMVRPSHFGFNAETASSNVFQTPSADDHAAAAEAHAALGEFDALAERLTRAGIEVVVVNDSPEPVKPDAVFPNNWVSFHGDGSVVLYPMFAPNRRLERREEVVAAVLAHGAYRNTRTVDLTHHEGNGRFLEGTGSLVLDRVGRIAYAALSPRTHLDVLGEFSQRLGYELITFETGAARRTPVYHTNVLMALGSAFAVLCSGVITDAAQRVAVIDKLQTTGHEVLELDLHQMRCFAGNLLELRGPRGPVIALSTTAWGSLEPWQRRLLENRGEPLIADIPLIEQRGGGSVRCMLAEIHLPRRGPAGPAGMS